MSDDIYDTEAEVKGVTQAIRELNEKMRALVDHNVVVQVTMITRENQYQRKYPELKLDGAWKELNPPQIILPKR